LAVFCGKELAEGTGTKTNLVLAVRWWRKAAQKGDAKAHNNLGSSCIDGWQVRSNKRLGAVWLKKAASHGHKKAARELRA
jgi:uncharacterized protein